MAGKIEHIKNLMHEARSKGINNVDIGANILEESTLMTVKEKDFRAENVILSREKIFIEGYYENGTMKTSLRLEQVDEAFLPELAWSLESVINKL